MSKANRKRTIDQLSQMDEAPTSRRASKSVKPTGRKSGIKSNKEFDVIEIYDYLKTKDSDIEHVNDLLDRKIKELPDKALEDIFALVFRASGYSEVVPNLTVTRSLDVDMEKISKQIYDLNLKKGLNDFPLLGKAKEQKSFKTEYTRFWHYFVKHSENFVFNTDCLNVLVAHLSMLARSKLKTIRYAAVHTLLSVSHGLCDLCFRLKDEHSKQQGLLKDDKKKSKQNEEIERSNAIIKQQIIKVEKVLGTVNKDFIKKRYEDTMSEIRLEILEYLNHGISRVAYLFLEEATFSILKYFIQQENEYSVISACLDVADQLVKTKDQSDKIIEKSLKAMKREFLELCFHPTAKIAARAFKFVRGAISLLDFKNEELKELYPLILYNSEDVTQVASDFIITMSFDGNLLNDAYDNEEFIFVKKSEDSKNQLNDLAKIFSRMDNYDITYERVERFVEAFFRRTQVFCDFQSIFNLIVENRVDRRGSTKSDREKEVLIRFAEASIKLSKDLATSNSLFEKQIKPFAARVLVHAKDVVRIRANELLTYSKLNNSLLESLVNIFNEVDLNDYFVSSNKSQYKAFLDTLRSAFEINSKSSVVGSIAKFLATYSKNPEIRDTLLNTVDDLSEGNISLFLSFFKKYEEGNISDDVQKPLTNSLLKLSKLSTYFTIAKVATEPFTNRVFRLVDSYVNQENIFEDIVDSSLYLTFFSHMWRFLKITKNEDVSDQEVTEYLEFRERVMEKFIKFLKAGAFPGDRKQHLHKLQETSLSLAVQTLCFVSSDKLIKVKGLYYRPPKSLLQIIYDYVVLIDRQTTRLHVENSDSKKLVNEIKKSKRLTDEDESEDDDDERGEELQRHESPAKKKEEDSKGRNESINERLLVTCSLISKLFMTCTAFLNSEFAVNTICYLIKKSDSNVDALVKSMLTHFRTKDIHDTSHINYWRFVDWVLVKLQSEGDIRRACDFAKLTGKIYYEKLETQPEEKRQLVRERYLKYLINAILYSISTPSKYEFLTVASTLANKSYLDTNNYKKVLAFFEVELKHKSQEDARGRDDPTKEVYLNRFRQQICKITGLKYTKPKSVKKTRAVSKSKDRVVDSSTVTQSSSRDGGSPDENSRSSANENSNTSSSSGSGSTSEPPLMENQSTGSEKKEDGKKTRQPKKIITKKASVKKVEVNPKKRKTRSDSVPKDKETDEMKNGLKLKKQVKKK